MKRGSKIKKKKRKMRWKGEKILMFSFVTGHIEPGGILTDRVPKRGESSAKRK